MGIITVTSKGQITIPTEVRRALSLKEKDKVIVRLEGNRAVIEKIPPLLALKGSVPVSAEKRGVSWKKIQKETRRRRGKR